MVTTLALVMFVPLNFDMTSRKNRIFIFNAMEYVMILCRLLSKIVAPVVLNSVWVMIFRQRSTVHLHLYCGGEDEDYCNADDVDNVFNALAETVNDEKLVLNEIPYNHLFNGCNTQIRMKDVQLYLVPRGGAPLA